ncbi:helix-turn-helix domain-containing protein [Paenibacillus solisilvae]|uniref:Helix-turn-helix domain-containing protein n=1 Tax=Paenibacillus solisilvae TaxID=2486751 RepID=A0ABW0VVD8_9BACL
MHMLQFTVPPLPYFISCGYTNNGINIKHVSRRNIRVFDLLVVQKGCLFIGEEEREYEVKEGSALILKPDSYHYGMKGCQELTSYYWLHFQTAGNWSAGDTMPPLPRMDWNEENLPEQYYNMKTFQIQLPQFVKVLQRVKMEVVLQQLVQLNQSAHLTGSKWKQQVLFQDVIEQLSASNEVDSSTPSAACAEQAAAYLRKHYREEITAQAMGESMNFHPVYIARCMQKEYGCSPMEYLLQYRIEQAKLMLLQTDRTIARIAEEVGFNQAAYFTSCFSKFEGISPRKYRQRFSHG